MQPVADQPVRPSIQSTAMHKAQPCSRWQISPSGHPSKGQPGTRPSHAAGGRSARPSSHPKDCQAQDPAMQPVADQPVRPSIQRSAMHKAQPCSRWQISPSIRPKECHAQGTAMQPVADQPIHPSGQRNTRTTATATGYIESRIFIARMFIARAL
jgi:hypothetical protein